jgi:hypothetical protein
MLCCVGGALRRPPPPSAALRRADSCARILRPRDISTRSISEWAGPVGASGPFRCCALRFPTRRAGRVGEICLAPRTSPLRHLPSRLHPLAGQAGSTVLLCRSLLCYTVTRPPRPVEPTPRTVHSSHHAVERFHHAEERSHRTENAPPRAGKPYHHTVEPSHRTGERSHRTGEALPRAGEPFPRGLLPIEPTPTTLN